MNRSDVAPNIAPTAASFDEHSGSSPPGPAVKGQRRAAFVGRARVGAGVERTRTRPLLALGALRSRRTRRVAPHVSAVPPPLDTASTEELVAIIADAEATKARAYVRLMAPRPAAALDQTLNAREVATRIGMGKDWVYQHADEIPGAWRRGKILRFSAAAVEAWKRGVR
jgi:predicted DNA-binding transcriptional regulator AlpA